MSVLWTEEWARLRSLPRRVPGGSTRAALVALALLAVAAAGVGAVTAYVAVLVLLPPVVGLASLLLRTRRDRVAAGGAALLLLAAVGALLATRGAIGLEGAGVLGAAGLGVLLVGGVAEVWAARAAALETALQVARDAIDAVAVRDPLTGVANTHGLELVGRQIVETARRQGDAVHCTFVEVEGLDEARRRAADSAAGSSAAGSSAADSSGADSVTDVLVALAEALRAVTRTTDVVARWQDATFCIVGQGTGVEPSELERRVRRRLGADDALDREVWSGRISVGGAMLPPWDSGTLETLLVRAAEELRARSVSRRGVRGATRPASEVHERQAGEAG